MAKKERTGDDGSALKGGLIVAGLAVAAGVLNAFGHDVYDTVRDSIGNWREERRKRKEKEAKAAKAADAKENNKKKKKKKNKKKSR